MKIHVCIATGVIFYEHEHVLPESIINARDQMKWIY